MKKLLTILLSMLIVFSSCLVIGADENPSIVSHIENGTINVTYENDGDIKVQIVPNEGYVYPKSVGHTIGIENYKYDSSTGVVTFNKGTLNEIHLYGNCRGGSIEGLSLKWYQDENKNLVIEATGDKSQDFINYLVNTQSSVINADCGAFWGIIMNFEDNIAITKGDGKVTISKDSLVNGGYVNGDYVLYFSGSGYEDLVLKINLNIGVEAPKSTQASTIKVSGKVKNPLAGESTTISNNALTITDQDGNPIPEYNSETELGYSLSWCEKSTNAYGNVNYIKTSDKVFVEDKEYYLMLDYVYVLKDNTTPNIDTQNSNLTLDKTDNFFGYTGGSFLMKTGYQYYIMKYTAGKVETKQTASDTLSSDFVKKAAIKNSAIELEKLVTVTSDEQQAIDAGKKLEVQMKINNQTLVSSDDVTKVKTTVSDKGLTAGAIYDIKLYKNIEGNSTATQVTNTNLETEISFPLEQKLVNTDSSINREYKVVRIHEGEEPAVIDATYNETTKSITFKTDKFSTYAICYKDTKKKETNTSSKTYSAKDKNQDGIITCDEEMNSANWVWSTSKGACVYKVSNTSVR